MQSSEVRIEEGTLRQTYSGDGLEKGNVQVLGRGRGQRQTL